MLGTARLRPVCFLDGKGQKMRALFIVCCLALAGTAMAGDSHGETTIGMNTFKFMYESQGPNPSLPKVLVYSPKGECVGVTTADETPAEKLGEFVAQSLRLNRRQCSALYSNEFGVTEVGARSATGKPAVQLITWDEPFCGACGPYRRALSQQLPSGAELTVVHVDLTLKHNPPRDPAKVCDTCGKEG